MTQQSANDNSENKSSVSKTQDAILNSKKTIPEIESKVEEKKSFTEKWETSRFLLVRGSYQVLRSVWIAVMFIGGFIAWLISLLFV